MQILNGLLRNLSTRQSPDQGFFCFELTRSVTLSWIFQKIRTCPRSRIAPSPLGSCTLFTLFSRCELGRPVVKIIDSLHCWRQQLALCSRIAQFWHVLNTNGLPLNEYKNNLFGVMRCNLCGDLAAAGFLAAVGVAIEHNNPKKKLFFYILVAILV